MRVHTMAKTKKAGQIYQLKITLRDIQPPVWRRVQVEDGSLSELHDIIQTSMGWGGYHLHSFEIGGEPYSEPDPDGMMETEDGCDRQFRQFGQRMGVIERHNGLFCYSLRPPRHSLRVCNCLNCRSQPRGRAESKAEPGSLRWHQEVQ